MEDGSAISFICCFQLEHRLQSGHILIELELSDIPPFQGVSRRLHICITGVHTMKLAKQFIKDINSSIENINKNNITKTDGMFEIYGTSQKI